MGFDQFKFIFGVCMIALVNAGSVQSAFECYGDVCNLGKVHQFCSNAFKYCRNCDAIKEDCGTAAQPLNCTAFCIETLVTEALKQKREKDEDSCLVVPVMMNIANGQVLVPQHNDSRIAIGSELVYSCDNGYTLNGPSILECMRNGTLEPTIMPSCSGGVWIGYKYATIILSGIWVIQIAALVWCCLKRKLNEQIISRSSTDSSLYKEKEALLSAEKQTMHDEYETPSVQDRALGGKQSTHEVTKPVNAPATPSAPPAEHGKDHRDGQETQNKSSFPSHDTRGQEIIIHNTVEINNQTIVENVPMTQETHGKHKAKSADFTNHPTGINHKSIDEKMPTEETYGTEAVEETNDEKKGRGTKPIPARDPDFQTRAESSQEMFEAKEATLKGPQHVPAFNEEHIKTPTKETAESNAMVGIDGSTFQKNDIQKNETKFIEKSEDHNYTQELVALKEA